jgi:hypothetical protein
MIKPKCFVLMPFDKTRLEVYRHAIRPAADAAEFECHRADDAFENGAIVGQIVRDIFSDDVIVADISDLNPNVLYELGIAHAVGNKTIIICEAGQELPFNLNAYRVIFYEKTINGGVELREQLEKALRESIVRKPGPTNPVQHFRPVIYATPLQEQARLEAEINRLRNEVERLKKVELHILMLTLPNYQFRHLLYLASENDYQYDKHTQFVEELRKLRALGLIKSKDGVKIGGIPESGNLKDYVEITELARQVVEELRELTRNNS